MRRAVRPQLARLGQRLRVTPIGLHPPAALRVHRCAVGIRHDHFGGGPLHLICVSETYRNLESYRFEFVTTHDSRSEADGLRSERRSDQSFLLAGSSPRRVRIDSKSSDFTVSTFSDGQTTWTLMPSLREYTRQAAIPLEDDRGLGAPARPQVREPDGSSGERDPSLR